MELRTLQYFLAVTKEENITRAAKSLHISQPYLLKQLMEMENEFAEYNPHHTQNILLLSAACRSCG